MSGENVEIVQGVYEALNRGDLAAVDEWAMPQQNVEIAEQSFEATHG
jgi:ketosteroid isomerase-like protein